MRLMYDFVDMTGYCIECFAKAEGMDEDSVRELFIGSGLYDAIRKYYLIFMDAGEDKAVKMCRSYFDTRNISY